MKSCALRWTALPHLTGLCLMALSIAGCVSDHTSGFEPGATETRPSEILDLTGDDTGDPHRMVEIDAVLFVMKGIDIQTEGFNFLEAILDLGQTLILSGLSQRESRMRRKGVPILMENSELYRTVSGQDLTSEDVDLQLLGPRSN